MLFRSPELSTAENILHMLRADMQYTPFEAATLDMALLLHMEHGGGNNSTFTTRVVTSSMICVKNVFQRLQKQAHFLSASIPHSGQPSATC